MRQEEMRKERWAHVPHITTGVTDNIQPPNVALHFPPMTVFTSHTVVVQIICSLKCLMVMQIMLLMLAK